MKFSQAGKQALGEMEGCKLEVYLDSGGAPSIGIGHLLTRSERASGKIQIGQNEGNYREGLTLEQVYALLEQDLVEVELVITRFVKVYLTQAQYDALVCFVFNVGVSAFKGSTLLKLLNSGNYLAIPEQLMRWVHDNGVQVPGLISRRESEIALWEGDNAATQEASVVS